MEFINKLKSYFLFWFSISSWNLLNSKLKEIFDKNDLILSKMPFKLFEDFSISLLRYFTIFKSLYISFIISFSFSSNSFFFSSFFAPKKKLKALANKLEFLSSKTFFSTLSFVAFNAL